MIFYLYFLWSFLLKLGGAMVKMCCGPSGHVKKSNQIKFKRQKHGPHLKSMKMESTNFSFAFLFSSRWWWASRRDSGVKEHGVCQNSLSRHSSSKSGLIVFGFSSPSWFSLFSPNPGLWRQNRCSDFRFRSSLAVQQRLILFGAVE